MAMECYYLQPSEHHDHGMLLFIALGEGLVEVETTKVVEILEAPISGTLVRQVAEVGDGVPVRDVVAIIDDGVESGE